MLTCNGRVGNSEPVQSAGECSVQVVQEWSRHTVAAWYVYDLKRGSSGPHPLTLGDAVPKPRAKPIHGPVLRTGTQQAITVFNDPVHLQDFSDDMDLGMLQMQAALV